MTRVVIVSARIGAGHDGAATELARLFGETGWEPVRYDFLDLLPGRLGRTLCDAYHRQLEVAPRSWDWLLTALGTPGLAAAARGLAGLAVDRLRTLLDGDVALAVSTYPLASHALARLRRTNELSAPLAVYLTDPSVHRLCVTPWADLTIAPNHIAAGQARALGAGRTLVARPLVAPGFRPARSEAESASLRATFGLPVDRPLALVLSGSWGVGAVEEIAADVAASGMAVPVVVCGRNDALRRRLDAAGYAHVFGWVDRMPELIRACDLVVQNAGGLTTSEALACGVPVLTYRCLPGHGRANAAVLDEEGTVPWIRTPERLCAGLASALASQEREPEGALG